MSVLSSPWVTWLVVALVVLIAYQVLVPRLRLPGLSVDAVLSRVLGESYAKAKVDKEINRQRKLGNFLEVGRLLEEQGRLDQAVAAYLEGGELIAAASILERTRRGERAAELYLQAGDHKKAAEVLVAVGKPGKAASLIEAKGNKLEAARLYGLAGAWNKAGELYLKGGYALRAGEAFEKQGEFRKAAECYERHFMENVSYASTYATSSASKDQQSALSSGRLYEKAGDLERALQILSRGSFFKEAAQVAAQLGRFEKAGELFMRAEDLEGAAAAYEQGGDPIKAATLRGELAFKAGQMPEAAAYFQQGRDFLRAAELYESAELLPQAAGAFEAAESWASAGGVYLRAGLKEKAAGAFERAGEFETAAKLYEEAGERSRAAALFERSGQTFKSGEVAAAAGERERAIGLLQQVTPGDEHYSAATELLVRLFLATERPDLALERLQKVLGEAPVSRATLALHYWLGVAQEAAGQLDGALATYRRVLVEDMHYRDAGKRAAALEAGAPLALPTLVPAAPPPPPAARATPPASPAPTPAAAPPASPAPAPAAAPPASSGAAPKASRFRPQQEIGSGPKGVLLKAEDSKDGRVVALRALPPELVARLGVPVLVADLKAAASVSHPVVARVLGFVEMEGRRHAVTELVAGRNTADPLKAGKRMSMAQALGLGRSIAEALVAIHGRGLAHGSVQPSNIMMASGAYKLTDLGLGRLAAGRATPYRPEGTSFGPEADLYALAAVLHHVVTGAPPAAGPVTPPSKRVAGVSEPFDRLVLRGLDPRPEGRFPSAAELLAAIQAVR